MDTVNERKKSHQNESIYFMNSNEQKVKKVIKIKTEYMDQQCSKKIHMRTCTFFYRYFHIH